MSHYPQRKEKDCLNCGTEVQGKFCHLCGQENVEPKETFWHLVTHFVYDVTHFDGKFFSTLKYLLSRPGFLSKEYLKGKRMSYLNPIKMYVFISAFFFLFFFSVFKPNHETRLDENKPELGYEKVRARIEEKIADYQGDLKDTLTTQIEKQILLSKLPLLQNDLARISKDANDLKDLNFYKIKNGPKVDFESQTAYDSAQKKLPVDKRDGFIVRVFTKRGIEFQNKFGGDWEKILKAVGEKLFHSFPQLLFVFLPLFALILKLLYIRRKNFYYVDHVIYSVHLYCAMFVLMFLVFSLSELKSIHYFGWLRYLRLPLYLYIIWYQYKSAKNFYNQGRAKTIFKLLLLLMLSSFVVSLLTTLGFLLFAFTL